MVATLPSNRTNIFKFDVNITRGPGKKFRKGYYKPKMAAMVVDSSQSNAAKDGAKEVGQGLQVTIPRNVPHLYNNNFTVRLTYADNYRHEISQTGSGTSQIFRMDSIYDPDYTGGGHQPMFRDMWASQYDYYTVLACEYKIRLYNCMNDNITWTAVGSSGQKLGAVNVTLKPTMLDTDITSGTSIIYPIAETKNAQTDFLVPDAVVEFAGTLTPGDFLVDARDADSDQTWIANGTSPTAKRLLGYVITPAQWTTLIGVNHTPYSVIQAQVILDYTVQFTQINPTIRQVSS